MAVYIHSMNKIVKSDPSVSWGENPHRVLSLSRSTGSTALAEQAEKAVLRQYRIQIREQFEKNSELATLLTDSHPAISASAETARILNSIKRPETSDLFYQVVEELLHELDEQRERPGSLYLIDDSGKAVMPIAEQQVYQPQDYVGEDGRVHTPNKIVHPGVSAPLIMDRYNKDRLAKAIENAGEEGALAMSHMKDPDLIRIQAMDALAVRGISVLGMDQPSKQIQIEFGKENIDGVLQSPNLKFHRSYAFGSVLAKRIQAELGDEKRCFIGNIELKTNSKKRWYQVSVSI